MSLSRLCLETKRVTKQTFFRLKVALFALKMRIFGQKWADFGAFSAQSQASSPAESSEKKSFRSLEDEVVLERAIYLQKQGEMPEYSIEDGKVVVR